jgi:hypothetical protein
MSCRRCGHASRNLHAPGASGRSCTHVNEGYDGRRARLDRGASFAGLRTIRIAFTPMITSPGLTPANTDGTIRRIGAGACTTSGDTSGAPILIRSSGTGCGVVASAKCSLKCSEVRMSGEVADVAPRSSRTRSKPRKAAMITLPAHRSSGRPRDRS